MKILVTGAKGMLGSDLCPRLAREHCVIAWDIEELDITDTAAVQSAFTQESPELVVHCAAFTDVDGCERDPDRAYRINGLGTWNIASACNQIGAALAYISTDFVFDGEKGAPYDEFDTPNPIGAYGRSKLAGEIFVRQLVARHFIGRTAWLYGANGKNFVKTILRRGAEGAPLRVIADQVGSPTYTVDLAEAIAQIIATPLYGTYHLTNRGYCSWAQFAEEILRQAGITATVEHISADQWDSPTRRPKDSRLRHLTLEMQGRDTIRPWQEALADYIKSGIDTAR